MVNEIFKVNRSLLNFLVSTGIEINPFQPVVAFHIETSHLICAANQMIGFYMELKWVDYSREMFVFEFSNDFNKVIHLVEVRFKKFVFCLFIMSIDR